MEVTIGNVVTQSWTGNEPCKCPLRLLNPVRGRVARADTVLIPCMQAFRVEWPRRRRLAPILFEDDDRDGARAQ